MIMMLLLKIKEAKGKGKRGYRSVRFVLVCERDNP